MLRWARITAQAVTVIPPRSATLVPAKLIDPCDSPPFSNQKSGTVRQLLNQEDQPRTIYQDTVKAWHDPVEDVSDAGGQESWIKDGGSRRVCRVAS